MNLYSKKMTHISIILLSLALIAPIFFHYLVVRPVSFPMRDKSRVGDLLILTDHSNIQDRTGGKLSVSTELQLVNG